MSTKRLAIRGVAVGWIGRAVAFAMTFVVTPVLIHGFGDEVYGLWAIVMSFTSYYALADLGLRSAGVKYISQFKAAGDHKAANQVVITLLGMYSLLSLAVLLGAGCIAAIFPFAFDIGETSTTVICVVVLSSGFTVALRILAQVFGAVLAAHKRHDLIQGAAVVSLVCQGALIIVAVRCGGGLFAVAMVTLVVSVLHEFCRVGLAMRVFNGLSLSPALFERKLVKTLFKFGGLNVFQGVAKRVTQSSGAIIVGFLAGPGAATFYVLGESLVRKAGELCVGVGAILFPIASELHEQGRSEALIQAFVLASRVLLAASLLIATMFYLLGSQLMDFWIDPGYGDKTYPVLCLFAPVVVLHSLNYAARGLLMGMNRMWALAKFAIIDTTLTLVLGTILVTFMGMEGMAVAILIAQVVVAGILTPTLTCKLIGITGRRYLGAVVLPAAGSTVLVALIATAMVSWFPPHNIVGVIVEGLCILLAGGIGAFYFCFDRDMRATIVQSVLGIRRSGTS